MSSNLYNQDLTTKLAQAHPNHVIPAYGLHPWFCHPISFAESLPTKQDHYAALFSATPDDLTAEMIDVLPEPITIQSLLHELRQNLLAHPQALLGEVGLDKTFRIASSGNHIAPHSMNTQVKLTSLKTPISHQVAVLEAQMAVALELNRPMSLHCVGAQGPLFDLLGRLQKGNPAFSKCPIDLHSFGGSAESVQQLQKHHSNVYFSFSSTINSRSKKLHHVIQAVEKHRLLVESDWPSLRAQSDRLVEAVEIIAQAKGWDLEKTYVLSHSSADSLGLRFPTVSMYWN